MKMDIATDIIKSRKTMSRFTLMITMKILSSVSISFEIVTTFDNSEVLNITKVILRLGYITVEILVICS